MFILVDGIVTHCKLLKAVSKAVALFIKQMY